MSEGRSADGRRAAGIHRLLDEKLPREPSGEPDREPTAPAADVVQRLFVDALGFEPVAGEAGTDWRSLPVESWPVSSEPRTALVVAAAEGFRVLYVELDDLTRGAERSAVDAVAGAGLGAWADDGRYLAAFHAPGGDEWHLVTPYGGPDAANDGPTKLRRFALGAGRTHRTAARHLAGIAVPENQPQSDSQPRPGSQPETLAERIDEAFRVERVTERFYRDYTDWTERLATACRDEGRDADAATRYARLTIDRLVFLSLLQSGGWLAGRRDFLRWFHDQYRASDDEGCFHETWLDALLEALREPVGTAVSTDLPPEVAAALADLPPEVAAALADLPCLGEGRFDSADAVECGTTLPDDLLAGVLREFLGGYAFTATEGSAFDAEVAVDPSTLGQVHESLLAEAERGDSGAFFTPHAEVDLVCRQALYEQFARRTRVTPDRVVSFLFAEPHAWEPADDDERAALASVLRDLRVVDPACGAGAFLVGMARVLAELHSKLGHPVDDHRTRIVESLHGVDVDREALRAAEFRLWLWTAGDGDAGSDDRSTSPGDGSDDRSTSPGDGNDDDSPARPDLSAPVFPDLSAQLRAGDSLVQPGAADGADSTDGTDESPEDGRQSVAGDRFVWERDFAEVLADGGFDVVVGNPPYVRGRDISPPEPTREWLGGAGEGGADAGSTYRSRLREYVEERFGVRPYGASDLYVYFFFRGIDLLGPGGTLAFVTSNAWLNTRYGKRLQEGLLRATDLRYVLDNRTTRSFADAEINTVVTVANRSTAPGLVGRPSFVSVQRPYGAFLDESTARDLLVGDGDDDADEELAFRGETLSVERTDAYRAVSVPAAGLWSLGGGRIGDDGGDGEADGPTPRGTYGGDQWALYHRAPDVYFRVLDRAGDAVDELVEHVEDVRTGAYSGLNDFYYFETGRGAAFEERIDDRFLRPLVRRPGQVQTPLFEPSSLDTRVFVCRQRKADLRRAGHDAALAYVEWGETQTRDDGTPWPEVPSVADRKPGWWALRATDSRPTNLLVGYVVDTRFTVAFSEEPVTADRCFHRVYGDTDRLRRLHALLCSSLGPFLVELTGTANLGQGALKFETRLLKRLPVPDPGTVDLARVEDAVAALGARPVGSVFEELGGERPDEVTLDGVREDRRRLDRYVLGDLLGLDEAEQLELYRRTVEMVAARVGKADSV